MPNSKALRALVAMTEQEMNAIVAQLAHMTNGVMGRDWHTGREFVIHTKGDELPALRDALRVIYALRSALTAAEAHLASSTDVEGWRTMDSAPEDAIWVYVPRYDMQCVAWFADGQWWTPARSNGRVAIPDPTHWRPLPESPSPEKEGRSPQRGSDD